MGWSFCFGLSNTMITTLGLGQPSISLAHPQIMGILNVTPDSFSDGGQFQTIDKALYQTERMVLDGADLIDIGGESTRPDAKPVSSQQEIDRVLPVLERIRAESDVFISVDTSNPELMLLAADAGANLINDIRALSRPNAMECAAKTGLPICIMHMQGEPKTMQKAPSYQNIVSEILDFFVTKIEQCSQAGIDKSKLLLDPGFGFGKRFEHNFELLNQLSKFCHFDMPILVGMSRKSMIGTALNNPVDDRMIGSVAAALIAVNNGANIVRVHDVKATKQALEILKLTLKEGQHD